jgi:hypothetical protein
VSQRGRHIEHDLARIDELLSEQVAKPAGGLDRPSTSPEFLGPRQQLSHLLAGCPHPDSAEFAFVVAYRYRGVAGLVRVDTDDHRHEHLRGLT